MSNPQENVMREVREDEILAASSGPAVFTNRFFVAVTPAGVRIAFTEEYIAGKAPIFRSAVIIPLQDAIELGKVIQELTNPPTKNA